jgi:hypothetical protein
MAATRQERRRPRARAFAAAAAALVCAAGLLARHHQAEAIHVRDSAGAVHHAQHLAEQHERAATAHLHGRAGDGHTGECTLLALAHQPVVLAAAPTAPLPVSTHVSLTLRAPIRAAAIAPYRFAPKTSPPG